MYVNWISTAYIIESWHMAWSFTAAHSTQCFPPHLDSQFFCSVVTCTIHSDHAPKYSAPAGCSHGDVSSFTIYKNLTSSYPNYHLQLPSIELKVELYISNRTLQSTFRSWIWTVNIFIQIEMPNSNSWKLNLDLDSKFRTDKTFGNKPESKKIGIKIKLAWIDILKFERIYILYLSKLSIPNRIEPTDSQAAERQGATLIGAKFWCLMHSVLYCGEVTSCVSIQSTD